MRNVMLTVLAYGLVLIAWSSACCHCPKRKKSKEPKLDICEQTPYNNLPCYNLFVVAIIDGPLINNPTDSENVLSQHYGLIDRNGRARAISEARRALAFFRDKYGFDFPGLSDSEVLTGVRTNAQGVTFVPFVGDHALSRYRIWSVSVNDDFQLLNRPVYAAGWLLSFSQDTFAGGTYQQIVLANASIGFGAYIFEPCDPRDYSPCRNILNPDDPYAAVPFFFSSIDYVTVHRVPNAYVDINCQVFNPRFGDGAGRGYLNNLDPNDPLSPLTGALNFFFPETLAGNK